MIIVDKHLVDKTSEFVHAFLENFETAKEVLRDSTRVVVTIVLSVLKMTSFYSHPRGHVNARARNERSSLYHTGKLAKTLKNVRPNRSWYINSV